MGRHLLVQLAIVAIPFILYGLFRLATRNVREEGKAWPLQILFIIGLLASISFWIYVIWMVPGSRTTCVEPARMEGTEFIPERTYACETERKARPNPGKPATPPELRQVQPAPDPDGDSERGPEPVDPS